MKHLFLFFFSVTLFLVIFSVSAESVHATRVNGDISESITLRYDADKSKIIVESVGGPLENIELVTENGTRKINPSEVHTIANTYTDSNPEDDGWENRDIRYEMPPKSEVNRVCDEHSEILFIGDGDHDGFRSDTGWVARFWVDLSIDGSGLDGCDDLFTKVNPPTNMTNSGVRIGKWINKATISIVGFYLDENPFDSDYGFKQSNAERTQIVTCNSKIDVNDYTAGNKGYVVYKGLDSAGKCIVTGANTIILADTGVKDITAYKFQQGGKDTLLLPIFRKYKEGDCGIDIFTSCGFEQYPGFMGVFKQFPAGAAGANPDHFPRTTEGVRQFQSSVDEEVSGEYVKLAARQMWGKKCITAQCTTITETIKIHDVAPPADVYGTVDQVVAAASDLDTGTAPNAADAEPIPTCESQNKSVADWLFCLVIDGIDKTLGAMTAAADDLLSIEADRVFGDAQGAELRTVWSFFRGVATFLLLAVGLAMVISQAIGG